MPGSASRADRFAVVALGQADKTILFGLALVAPKMRSRLQRNLGGTGAVAGIKGVAKTCQLRQAFRQFDHRLMRQTGQHHMVQAVQLRVQCSLDVRMAMPKQIDPPRAHRIQVALAVGIKQPGALTADDGHQGLRLVVFHLCAGVPHGGAATLQQGFVSAQGHV
jgi:hypothetical protein